MQKIDELATLMLELFDEMEDEDEKTWEEITFSDRAVEIINEIADFAETTKLYKDNYENGGEQFAGEPAYKIYAYLCDRIINAPTILHRDASCILIMPFLRKALKGGQSCENN